MKAAPLPPEAASAARLRVAAAQLATARALPPHGEAPAHGETRAGGRGSDLEAARLRAPGSAGPSPEASAPGAAKPSGARAVAASAAAGIAADIAAILRAASGTVAAAAGDASRADGPAAHDRSGASGSPLAAPIEGRAPAEARRKQRGPGAVEAAAAPASQRALDCEGLSPEDRAPGPGLPRWARRLAKAALVALVALAAALVAGAAGAQEITVDLGGESLTARLAQLFVLVTLLSIAPGLAIMVTCFPFMVTVLSILRQAIGVQQAPPNMMIVSLALFLTYFVIEPVATEAWTEGVQPLLNGTIEESEGVSRAFAPFRTFMEGRVDADTLAVMTEAAPGRDAVDADGRPPVAVLIPAFLISEIQRGFEVGFLIFLPFLVIDLVIASVLMSMGMMMVPPAVVALPFKLAFFVVADGWTLLAGALVRGYAQ